MDSDYYYQQYYYINYVNELKEGQKYYWEVTFKRNSKANDYRFVLRVIVVSYSPMLSTPITPFSA